MMQSNLLDTSDSALVTHLQATVELDKASLVKELHDDLGGLMVAAVMDVAWAEEHFSSADARNRLSRVRDTLRSAIDLERKIIEDLRPSLLDNVGLFAALSRELNQTRDRTGLQCSGQYPNTEMHFTPDASIALFRIAQEALAIANTHSSATKSELCVSTEHETITLRFVSDEIPGSPAAINWDTAVFASMMHRIHVLGGNLILTSSPAGGTSMTITVPISRALLAPA